MLYKIGLSGLVVILLGVGAYSLTSTPDKTDVVYGPVDFSPVRGEMQPLRLKRTGFTYKCSECHDFFKSEKKRQVRVSEHTDLVLEHGANDYCFNCHHPDNRNVYVAYDGSEIPSDRPALLCSKCHGITYRDWLAGAHGRMEGAWNPADERSEKLLCIQCHDPHSPQFKKIVPMPGPVEGRVIVNGGSH